MNIIGIGHDLIEIKRIKKAHQEHGDRFLNRIYCQEELEYCLRYQDPYPSLAARFAAKEAGAKALGVGIGAEAGWHDLVVVRNARGAPSLSMSTALQERFSGMKFFLSLSHEKEFASAYVVLVL